MTFSKNAEKHCSLDAVERDRLSMDSNRYEIDLFELCGLIWQQKRIVLGVMIAALLLVTVYLLFVTPRFQAQSVLREVSAKDLDILNVAGLYEISQSEALRQVGSGLSSYALRYEFFKANPELFKRLNDGKGSLEQQFSYFNEQAFKVSRPDPKREPDAVPYVSISLTYPEGMDGPRIVNEFVQYVMSYRREQIRNDLLKLIDNRLETLSMRISASRAGYEINQEAKIAKLLEDKQLRQTKLEDEFQALRQQLKVHRMNRIAQLDEAIRIARQLNIQKPTTPSSLGEHHNELNGNVIWTEVNNQQFPLYFMGIKALQAERKALMERESDDFTEPRIAEIQKELALLQHNREVEMLRQRENKDLFLKDLAQWEEESAMLKAFMPDFSRIELARIDQPAILPFYPQHPKRLIIVAVGLVSGISLGIFAALVRVSILRTRALSQYKSSNT